MRICAQFPLQLDTSDPTVMPYLETVKNNLDKIKRRETEITFSHTKSGIINPMHLSYPGFRYMNDREILISIINAEKEGYDAVVVFCGLDPAVQASRQMVEIPVIGIFESSLHLAAMMGRRFAVITCDAAYIPQTEENIDKYRMRQIAISNSPVRTISLSTFECIACSEDPSPVVEAFKKTAAECISDGAEVLTLGCGVLSTMLTADGLNAYDGVPVLDPFIAGIKIGEAIAELHEAGFPIVSRTGLYIKAPGPDIESFLNNF